MKIGFFGNANNYPFTLARAIRSLGHDVIFIVDSELPLNRPESRYAEITTPYPSWIIDCSPLDLWQYPTRLTEIKGVIRILKECNFLILNEFGLSLWEHIQKPTFALLTGTDLEVLADPKYADFATGDLGKKMHFLTKIWKWRHLSSLKKLRKHLLHLIGSQRSAIHNAIGVNYFPKGMLPNGDRLLSELGVDNERRTFFFVADTERYQYTTYPSNKILRLFNVARITWKKPREHFICELDYKGTDVLIRGLGMFVRESKIPIEIRLVEKGTDVERTRSLIEEEGIASSVTWLKEMDQIKIFQEYQNADIVSENFGQGSIGMGALDAMAVGRPVIANGTMEIFRDALGEAPPICHASNPAEICDQLLRLAVRRDLRVSIGMESRLYVEKFFHIEKAVSKILQKLNAA